MKLRCRVLGVLLGLCLAVQWTFFVLAWSSLLAPDGFMQLGVTGLDARALRALSVTERALGALAALAPLLALSYGLWRLQRLLANIRRRALFDLSSIAHLRAFAAAILASVLLTSAEPPLRNVMWRLAGGTERGLALGFSSEALLLALVCAVFYLVTGMMHEARRLADENEGFV
jgi:hypothetical protein